MANGSEGNSRKLASEEASHMRSALIERARKLESDAKGFLRIKDSPDRREHAQALKKSAVAMRKLAEFLRGGFYEFSVSRKERTGAEKFRY